MLKLFFISLTMIFIGLPSAVFGAAVIPHDQFEQKFREMEERFHVKFDDAKFAMYKRQHDVKNWTHHDLSRLFFDELRIQNDEWNDVMMSIIQRHVPENHDVDVTHSLLYPSSLYGKASSSRTPSRAPRSLRRSSRLRRITTPSPSPSTSTSNRKKRSKSTQRQRWQ